MRVLEKIGMVEFPPPQGININMMPFIVGDDNSIPEEYRHYCPMLRQCYLDEEEMGKVGYLSITETSVKQGESQRRPGIHTEKHPNAGWGGGGGWGGGKPGDKLKKGLYQTSNVDDSCKAWDILLARTGKMGDCEHLREVLEESPFGVLMKKNELYWLTDSCPHESLPLKADTERQWFRFVTSDVSIWYKEHSTANRLGVAPAAKIIRGSKFS